MTEVSEAYGFSRAARMLDRDGDKIGKIDDDLRGQARPASPSGRSCTTGLFGTKRTVRAAARARARTARTSASPLDEGARQGRAATIDADGELRADEERDALPRTTAVAYADSSGPAGARRARHARPTAASPARDTCGPTTDDAMTRSEEELRVGTERRETRSRAPAQVRGRPRQVHRDGAGAPRGGPRRARADHRRQRDAGARRPGDLRGGARGRTARGAAWSACAYGCGSPRRAVRLELSRARAQPRAGRRGLADASCSSTRARAPKAPADH